MKSVTMLAKIVASITGAQNFDADNQVVMHFREIGRRGCGVALIDRTAGETTFVEVTNQSHVDRPPMPTSPGQLLTRGYSVHVDGESGRG